MTKQFDLLEEYLIDYLRQDKVPGLVVGIVKDNKLIYSQGLGARDLVKLTPMTPTTLFGIGSITKSLTSLAIMQLVEQGRINIEDPVKRYLPFKLGSELNPVTIHHLLTHTSGIANISADLNVHYRQFDIMECVVPVVTEKDFLHYVNNAIPTVIDIPNSRWMYNNDMYTILGMIIKKVSKLEYADFIRENILNPLGMIRSTFKDYEKSEELMTGYYPSEDGKNLIAFNHATDTLSFPHGGLFSTVEDISKYMIALLNGGNYNSAQIIQTSSLNIMWSEHFHIPFNYLDKNEKKQVFYGYGWAIEQDFFGYKVVQHSGSIGTSGSYIALIPELKIGVIVGQNTKPLSLISIVHGILAVLLGKSIEEALPELKIARIYKNLIGEYQTFNGYSTGRVIPAGGGLVFKTNCRGERVYDLMLPLAPVNIAELKFEVPSLFPGPITEAQFFIDEKLGDVKLQIDRDVFFKIR